MYDEDRPEVLREMQEKGVGGLVVGVDNDSSRGAIVLVEKEDNLFATVGLHPNATTEEAFDMEMYRALAKHPKVVAIGECGLDMYRPERPERARALQLEVFEKHLQLAVETEKPLMIHCRPAKGTSNSYEDLLALLTSYKKEFGDKLSGNIHFFVGDTAIAKKLLELDFTMSFTAVLTFTHDYDEVISYLPATHIISETDSPYLAPEGKRGTRNVPTAVISVVEAIAGIRKQDTEEIRLQILNNAKRVFLAG